MKTLNINISDDDFIKYNLQQSVLSFEELVAKIKTHTLNLNAQNHKTKFEDTPAFALWQDREDMADVEHYVETLRKPRQHNIY